MNQRTPWRSTLVRQQTPTCGYARARKACRSRALAFNPAAWRPRLLVRPRADSDCRPANEHRVTPNRRRRMQTSQRWIGLSIEQTTVELRNIRVAKFLNARRS